MRETHAWGQPHRQRGARFLLLLALLGVNACADGREATIEGERRRHVVFLTTANERALPAEETAALQWVRSLPDTQVDVRQFRDLPDASLPAESIAWWHYAEAPNLPSEAVAPAALATVRRHLALGGRLFLSLFAASYVVPLGIETKPPDTVRLAPVQDFASRDDEDQRPLIGVQSYRGHPLLRRFWGGVFTSTPTADRYPVARYSGDNWPTEGNVWAVARRHVDIDSSAKVGVEYPGADSSSRGLVLTLGEACYLADSNNHNRRQLEQLLEDVLAYLSGDPTAAAPTLPMAESQGSATTPPDQELADLNARASYWRPQESGVRAAAYSSEVEPSVATTPAVLEAVTAARSGLALEQSVEPSEGFDLNSPQLRVIGDQRGQLQQIWWSPMLILEDLRFGVRRGERPVAWLHTAEGERTFTARPEGNSIRLVAADLAITLHLAPDRARPALLALLAVDAVEPVQVVATWTARLRPAWPRQNETTGVMALGWDETARATIWRDSEKTITAMAGFGLTPASLGFGIDSDRYEIEPLETLFEQPPPGSVIQGSTVAVEVAFDPRSDAVLPFVIAAGTDPATVGENYRALLADPASMWAANATHFRELLSSTLDLTTPDPTFDEAFRWAKVGIETLRSTNPETGASLVSGCGSAASAGSGQTGYSTRDALWAGMAADTYGRSDVVAETLKLLARYRDVDGKIPSRISPSWAVYHDAADTAPLFLIGLEHHLRATRDRDLLRQLWPTVLATAGYLLSNDLDGDGLPESNPASHGWTVGGSTHDAHSTLYLAGLWAAGLQAAARISDWAGDEELATRSADAAEQVRAALDRDYWDADDRFFFHAKNADGTFRRAHTLIASVPMAFRLLDPGKATPLLDLFASAEFSSDWGARMVGRSDPDYRPDDLQHGAVAPLFSGWAAAAEYAYHRPLAGYLHLANNLRLYRHGNLGYLEPALHGERFVAQGQCLYSAASRAMAILPAVEGLLGIRSDAMDENGLLELVPHLPGGWNRITASPIGIGDERFRLIVVRASESTEFIIERLAGERPTRLLLGLPVPQGVLINLDRTATTGVAFAATGEQIRSNPFDKEAVVEVTLVEPRAVVTFRHGSFPEVVVTTPTAVPGAPNSALRWIQSSYHSGALDLRVEGLPQRTYRFAVTTPWPVTAFSGVPATRVIDPGPGQATLEFSIPGAGDLYQRAELSVEFRR